MRILTHRNVHRRYIVAAILFITLVTTNRAVVAFSFATTESEKYLIIARERVNGNTDVNTNNFELGANKAPVPSTSNFLNGGSTGGPGLLGNVPNIPLNAQPVFTGVSGHGNIAVTDPAGTFKLQDVGVYADPGIGIRLAGSSGSLNTSQNSFFNDPNQFPNTFTSTGFTNPGVNNNTGGFGTKVNPNDAVQATRIDPPGNGGFNSGITFGFNFTSLLTELGGARTAINALAGTGTLNTSGNGGKISTHTTFNAAPGLNVIDINTGGNDFLIENSNFVIDGPAGATVIFRLPDTRNMLISNSNVLIGNGGIGLNNILFYTDQNENDTHFNFNNTIINGAAFWSLSPAGGTININNAQGCTQLVADIVDLDNVRFATCTVPEPHTLGLFVIGTFAFMRHRRLKAA